MEGGGCYWQGLASALGVSAQDLLYWDKFGRNKELYLKPEDKPDDMDDPNLMVRLARHGLQLGYRAGQVQSLHYLGCASAALMGST